MPWHNLPPGPVHYLIVQLKLRLREDRGDVSITGTIIIAASLAAIALVLAAAISGKVSDWIAKIPG